MLWGGGERKLDLCSRFQCLAEDNVRSIAKTRKSAFTLAEVLITLVIIGVVAALTIPVLNNKYQEQTYKSVLKKNVTVFQQALDRYYADNGEYFIEPNVANMKSNYAKFLSYLNAEDVGTTDGILKGLIDGKYKDGSGGVAELDEETIADSFGCRMADGTDVFILLGLGEDEDGGLYLYIDLNGVNKGPNDLGKDFLVLVFAGKTNKLLLDKSMFDLEDEDDLFTIAYKMLYE